MGKKNFWVLLNVACVLILCMSLFRCGDDDNGHECTEETVDQDCPEPDFKCQKKACIDGKCDPQPNHQYCINSHPGEVGWVCNPLAEGADDDGCVKKPECTEETVDQDCPEPDFKCQKKACIQEHCVAQPNDQYCKDALEDDYAKCLVGHSMRNDEGCVKKDDLCTGPEDCNDNITCTIDKCVDSDCIHEPDHNECAFGIEICDPANGDPVSGCAPKPCNNAMECQDGIFCNGEEACVSGKCSEAENKDPCKDEWECTVDTCTEQDHCLNTPVNDYCINAHGDKWYCFPQGASEDSDGCVEQECSIDDDCKDMPGQDSLFCTEPKCIDHQCKEAQVVCPDDGYLCTVEECKEPVEGEEPAYKCEATNDHSLCANPENEVCNPYGYEIDPITGCTAKQKCIDDSNCLDENYCNGIEKCVDGFCRASPSPECDPGEQIAKCQICVCYSEDSTHGSVVWEAYDNFCNEQHSNPCEKGRCNPQGGNSGWSDPDENGCQYIADDTLTCSDNNKCNGIEYCEHGVCMTENFNCNDGNPCTEDFCDPLTGCYSTSLDVGTSCSDGNICNGEETCEIVDEEITCVQSQEVFVCPSVECMTVECIPGGTEAQACVYTPTANQCDDADQSTVNDQCIPDVSGNIPISLCQGMTMEICGDGTNDNPDPPGCGGRGTFVSYTGSDSNGKGTVDNPFRTIHKGIETAKELMIAMGTDIQAVYVSKGTYLENTLVMAPGVSVFGSFRVTSTQQGVKWERAPTGEIISNLIIGSDKQGVLFSSDKEKAIGREVVLDGFDISTAGTIFYYKSNVITIINSSPSVTNNIITLRKADGGHAFSITGNNANPLVAGNTIKGDDCVDTVHLVYVEDASAVIVNNIITGYEHPLSLYDDSAGAHGFLTSTAVYLKGARDVKLAYNTKINAGRVVEKRSNSSHHTLSLTGVYATQTQGNLEIVGNKVIEAGSCFAPAKPTEEETKQTTPVDATIYGIYVEDCAQGARVAISNNQDIIGGYIEGGTEIENIAQGNATGIIVSNCAVEILDNARILGCESRGISNNADAIICHTGSKCEVKDNNLILGGEDLTFTGATRDRACGLTCKDDSCVSVFGNDLIEGGRAKVVIGVDVGQNHVLTIDSNHIVAGTALAPAVAEDESRAVGLMLRDNINALYNNVIFGDKDTGDARESVGLMAIRHYYPADEVVHVNVNGNYINGRDFGLYFDIAQEDVNKDVEHQGDYQNNIISGGRLMNSNYLGISVYEAKEKANPRTFEANDVLNGAPLYQGYIYDEQIGEWSPFIANMASEINFYLNVQQNISANPLVINERAEGDLHLRVDSFCIDKGTKNGVYAPLDMDGDQRPGTESSDLIDIGPDEYIEFTPHKIEH